jgi:urease accessory protein
MPGEMDGPARGEDMARLWQITAALAAGLALVPPALAHHAMGGETPGTVWQGLLSGLGHPVIGLDHLAFVLGIGALAYLMQRVVLVALLFVTATVIGCTLHVRGYALPAPELAIALTVAVAAALVAWRAKLSAVNLAALLLVAGVFHGYAYGESIVGAETAPLAAYMVGFGVIQGCVAVGSALALQAAIGRDYLGEASAMRLAGAALALVAVAAFATAALAG